MGDMVDLGVPTAILGPGFPKDGKFRDGPPAPWYPNVMASKFNATGALTVYRQCLVKEVPEKRLRNGYQLRSAIKLPAPPNHPHTTDPARERGPPPHPDGGVDVAQWGFDPEGEEGKFLRQCVDDKRNRRGPQDRLPYSERECQVIGWSQAKPLKAYRSRSIPKLPEEFHSTAYEWLTPTLHENAKRNHQIREKRASAAEASVDNALKRCLSYTYHGDASQRWARPQGSTDATHFQKFFIENMKVEIHKCDPKPTLPIILKKPGKSQNMCDPWKP